MSLIDTRYDSSPSCSIIFSDNRSSALVGLIFTWVRCKTFGARQRQDLSRHSAASPTAHILAEGDRTAWLGWEDSNSEMSLQNIPLKGRTDFQESTRILAIEIFASPHA